MVKIRKPQLQVDQAQRKEGGKNKESTDMIEGGGDDGFVNGNENAVYFFFFGIFA